MGVFGPSRAVGFWLGVRAASSFFEDGAGTVQNEVARSANAELKRTVYRNADGKCQMCKSTYANEDDHIIPYAKGGKTTLQNLRLLCRNCNQRQGFLVFGDYCMKKQTILRSE